MFPDTVHYFCCCSSSAKNAICNLTWTAINLNIVLGSIIIFMILIVPIQEHNISLYLFIFISFISVIVFYIQCL